MKLRMASRWTWRMAALLVLVLVFMSYLQPDLVMQLATQIWGCL